MRRLSVLVAVGSSALLLAGGAAPAAVSVGSSTLRIPCGPGINAPTDWYRPSGVATGLVWLQHGYLGSKSDVAELGRQIAARTGALVVAPTVPSSGNCWIDGTPLHAAVAQVLQNRSALASSASAAGWTQPLPSETVVAGHSSGGLLAAGAAAAGADVRAVVMLDGAGTDPAAATLRAALAAIPAVVPVLQLGAPPGPCLPDRRGTRALIDTRPGQFVGVELVNGNHLDAIGYVSFLANLACGWPRLENVAAVQQIAADWITNALTGSSVGITGGTPCSRVTVGAATAVVLN